MDSERLSPRRHLKSIERAVGPALLLCWATFACHTNAQSPAAQSESTAAESLQRFLDSTQTLQATFDQELLGTDGEVIEFATGRLLIKRPGRFSWNYTMPIEQLVVADGTNLWIYDIELAQATVTPLDDSVAASPAMLLSGDAVLDAEFEIIENFDRDGLRWVRLAPKRAGADFRELLIGFRADTLSQLRLLDTLDQVTTIELSDVAINVDLADALFQFAPPAGVDVIGEAG
jgi:outer membrane lipoprotein carrier protein